MANNMLLPVSRYTSPAFPLNPPFARGSYTPETSSNQSRGPKVDQLRTVVVVIVVSGFLLFPTLTPHPINPHSNFPSSLLLSLPHPCTHFISIPRYVSLQSQRRYAPRHAHSPQRHHGTTDSTHAIEYSLKRAGLGWLGLRVL